MTHPSYASMTAFAQVDLSIDHYSIQLRIKSVNHKNLKLHLYCGANPELETWATKLFQTKLSRGHIEFHIDVQMQHRDEEELSKWIERCRQLNLPSPTWSDLYSKRLQGSTSEFKLQDTHRLYQPIEDCLKLLMDRRLEEGQAMVQFMLRDIKTLKALLYDIHRELPQHHNSRVERFKAKLQQLLMSLDGEVKDNLTRECAQLLERIDVQEECDRLQNHLALFENTLTQQHKGGKYCDFLCQEIHREITTLGNKSQSSLISEWVVSFKTHLEKLREQCQNLE